MQDDEGFPADVVRIGQSDPTDQVVSTTHDVYYNFGAFIHPRDIAFDPSGNLYVTYWNSTPGIPVLGQTWLYHLIPETTDTSGIHIDTGFAVASLDGSDEVGHLQFWGAATDPEGNFYGTT